MKRNVTISSVQPRWVPYKENGTPYTEAIAENKECLLAHLHEAGRRGSDIVLLPEICTHAGLQLAATDLEQYAETLDNDFIRQVGGICRQYKMHVIASVNLKLDGNLHNSCVLLDRRGAVAGLYHKVHLTYPELERGLKPGMEFCVFRLDFGTVGAMICHDMSFVESARCLALLGAEVIFWPHLQTGWGDTIWDIQLRARAIDNGCIVVSSSYSDKSEQNHWQPGRIVGRSGILNDDGIIFADIGRGEGIVTAVMDMSDKRRAHQFCYADIVDYQKTQFAFRHPEAYRPITGV
jgi:predicted amidohydrolase